MYDVCMMQGICEIDSATNMCYIIQLCSGITHGRVLNGEPYAQRFQKLIYLHLFEYVLEFNIVADP